MAATPIYKRLVDLADRMATALGLDLADMVTQDTVLIDRLGDALLRGTICPDVGGCERWLAAQQAGTDRAPGICRNGGIFELPINGGRARR